MPQVSVVIPTHNRAECLPCAITSALNQTFQDFEIIVVDDASQDNTTRVVESFNDQRIQYLRHETTQGAAKARNAGILRAKGKYIAFLDDDDEWLPEKLKMQVDILETSPSTLGGVYTGSLDVQQSTGEIVRQLTPSKRGKIFDEMLIQNWIGPTSTVMLKRECFEKVGLFDMNISFAEDYDMWIRVSKEYDFEYIKQPLVKFHYHENGLSNNYEMMIRGWEALIEKYGALFASNKKIYSLRFLYLGIVYCRNGNMKKGRAEFLKAIRLYPFDIRHYYNLCLSTLGTDWFKTLKKFRDMLSGA